jgi:thiol:disulfide interchange protein DsbC
MKGTDSVLHANVRALTVAIAAALASSQAAAAPPTKAGVEAAIPGLKVKALSDVPGIAGLYEVIDNNGQFLYVDADLKVAIAGEMYDIATRRSLSQERLAAMNVVDFQALPFELAIKRVKGSGRRRMAVFADPDCPYCAQLEETLREVDDVTIYTFVYPVDSLHPLASAHANAIWCAADRDLAWRTWMLERKPPAPAAPADCAAPLQQITAIAPEFAVRGTPSLVFASGRVAYGALPADKISGYLDEARLPRPADSSTTAVTATGSR